MLRLRPPFGTPDELTKQFVYGGTDAWMTHQLHGRMLGGASPFAYAVQAALVPPVLACMARGMPVDEDTAKALYRQFDSDLGELTHELQEFVQQHLGWGGPQSRMPFNPGSDQQLMAALHGRSDREPCEACGWSGTEVVEYAHAVLEGYDPDTHDLLRYKSGPRKGMPKHRDRVHKDRLCPHDHHYRGFGTKPYRAKDGPGFSVNRENLGKLIARERGRTTAAAHAAAELAVKRLAYKAAEKPLGFVAAPRGPSGRYMYEFGIGMTDTFRFSSSENVYGEGSNVQNQQVNLRHMFRAPPGRLFGANDQAKAESWWAAALSGDEPYLRAHTSGGDTHAVVAHMMWPDLDWPEHQRDWKEFASTTSFTKVMGLPFSVPKDNLREFAKRTQHGVTRGQTAAGMAQKNWVSHKVAEQTLTKFFDFAAGLANWIEMIAARASAREIIHMGVRLPPEGFVLPDNVEGPAIVMHVGPGVYWWRSFRADPRASTTHRNMMAFALQSPSAMTTHLGFISIWNELDSHSLMPGVGLQLLSNQHDEVVYEFDDAGEADADAITERCRQALLWEYDVLGSPHCVDIGKAHGRTWADLK